MGEGIKGRRRPTGQAAHPPNRLTWVPPHPRTPPAQPPLLDALLDRVARGDHEAFASLYDALAPAVFGLASRVLRQAEQAEEVSQEVMLEVWQRATSFDPGKGSAKTWVLTLTHRRAVDRVRSSQASVDRDRRAASASHETAHDSVSEAVERRLDTEALRQCFERLTMIQRESVSLAYYDGLTYTEVARALDTPVGTVKTRMRDGLIRLRDCLGVSA
jgi:RNA polymerase sigma-70 factor (ECF subfamily)